MQWRQFACGTLLWGGRWGLVPEAIELWHLPEKLAAKSSSCPPAHPPQCSVVLRPRADVGWASGALGEAPLA